MRLTAIGTIRADAHSHRHHNSRYNSSRHSHSPSNSSNNNSNSSSSSRLTQTAPCTARRASPSASHKTPPRPPRTPPPHTQGRGQGQGQGQPQGVWQPCSSHPNEGTTPRYHDITALCHCSLPLYPFVVLTLISLTLVYRDISACLCLPSTFIVDPTLCYLRCHRHAY